MSDNLKRYIFITLGTLFVVIGIIGIFVPVLPTTPFLLLAAFFYLRGSKRFYDWLMNNRVCGSYIRNYIEGRGMPLRVKIFTIALLWTGIGISIWLTYPNLIVLIILLVVAIGVTIHIALLKSKKKQENTCTGSDSRNKED
jgi:uncharacterized membrane protein YbaN (DUF454 family)